VTGAVVGHGGGWAVRRAVTLTGAFVLAVTTAMVVVTATGASARVPATPKVKPGSSWNLSGATVCETDSFGPHRKFAAVENGNADRGSYKGTKKLTMTWTAGAASGAVFHGTFDKAAGDYSGTYALGPQSVPATLTRATTSGCDAITTSPESFSIVFGASNLDGALVTGEGGITPTGSVHFYACPGSSSPCSPTSPGVTDLGSVGVSGSGNTASATSSDFTPLTAGTSCFLGVYSGDDHYPPASGGDECFGVTKGASSVTTTPASASIAVGSDNSDDATVTVGVGVTPTGTVTFYQCGPDATATACTAAAGTELGSPVTLVAGQGDTATASSPDFSPLTTGTYCFLGVYSGDTNYVGGSDASTTDECFTVVSKP
jgi:hypothetical protein